MIRAEVAIRTDLPRSDPDAVERAARRSPTGRAAVVSALLIVLIGVSLVGTFDAILSARVRAGTDSTLRLSVLLPYLGVDGAYVLARALGITALAFAAASVGLGLETGRRRTGGLPVAPFLGQLHRQVSLATIALVVAHGAVPFTSAFVPFGGWTAALVPLAQPWSWGTSAKVFESLGIMAFYLMVVLGPTYYLLRGRHRLWSVAHALTLGVYGLCVLHAVFLGSDFLVRGPARVTLFAAQIPITLLMARRMRVPAGRAALPALRRVCGALALAASAGFAVVAGFGAAGAPLGGFPL